MQIQHLQSFVLLCQEKNISKCSQKLHISQQGLSRGLPSSVVRMTMSLRRPYDARTLSSEQMCSVSPRSARATSAGLLRPLRRNDNRTPEPTAWLTTCLQSSKKARPDMVTVAPSRSALVSSVIPASGLLDAMAIASWAVPAGSTP